MTNITDKQTSYCVKCKKMVEMKNPERITLPKTNRPALRGNCHVCGTKVFKIVSNKS